jgi:CRISPR system Cascade subunit CasB
MSDTAPSAGGAHRVHYWHRHIKADGNWRPYALNGPPGEELADLRAGLGREAGTVPEMWPYYTVPTDGRRTRELDAEHAALALYGLHQQSQNRPMHHQNRGVGRALRILRVRDRFSESALDRRLAAAVNANSVPAVLYRLRGLVTQLRQEAIPLDYDQLVVDLTRWHHPDSRQWVRRRWGLDYYARPSRENAVEGERSGRPEAASGT